MRLADTNILLYAVSRRDTDSDKRAKAATTLKEPELAMSVQVLQEFYYQATRPRGPAGLTHEQAMEFLQPFRALPTQETTGGTVRNGSRDEGEILAVILGRRNPGGGEDAWL